MRYYIFLILCATGLLAQNTIRQFSKPEFVTVYLTGADVGMNIKANLKKGRNVIILDSLQSYIDDSRIRVSTGGQAQILSFQYKLEPHNGPVYNPKIKSKYDDSIKICRKEIDYINSKDGVLNDEENLIKSFKLNNTGESRNTTKDLQELAKYYNTRIGEIREERLENSFEIKDINEKIRIFDELKRQEQLLPVPSEPKKENYQLEIEVYAEEAGNNTFTITYFTNQALWRPSYDIKVKDISSEARIITKANVIQSTNMPWENIKLTLSTRNPDQLSTLPTLATWALRLAEPARDRAGNSMYLNNALNAGQSSFDNNISIRGSRSSNSSIEEEDDEQIRVDGIGVSNQFTGGYGGDSIMRVDGLIIGDVNRTMMAVEYTPTLAYNIPNDNKSHNIIINEAKVNTDYSYYAIPKLDQDAFLIANIRDLSDLNLIPANANVYFENNLVGTTYLNPQSTDDTLKIGLGRDKDIVVSRNNIKNYKEGKFLSSNRIREYGYEIKVKNNHKTGIKITIEDQIPVSGTDQIKVTLEESSDAEFIAEKGLLKWRKEISPNKSEKLIFRFKVDAPENVVVK